MGGALAAGVAVGLAVALPLGAIGLLVLRTATQRGLRVGLAAATGVGGADLLYAAVAATAGGVLSRPIQAVAVPLRIVAAILLLVIAGRGLVGARRPATSEQDPPPARPWRTFAAFLGLTLLNPLTVLTFAAVVVALPPDLLDTAGARVAFVLGAGAASIAWQAVLAGAGAVLGQRLDPRWQRLTALAGNGAIAALAVAALLSAR
jgi:threonine/homoserine/homoserine lactone efflux protein